MNLEGKIEEPYRSLLEKLVEVLSTRLGDKLVSVVVYGSVARGSARKDSDIDVLIIAESLPKSRMKRQQLFLEVEGRLEPIIDGLWNTGFYVDFSPVILSVEEASKIRPIYLDMVEDSVILYDRGGFFNNIILRLRERLRELGSKRVWVKDKWYWLIKPDIRFGEVVRIE
jgi:predicted nucleotidyltransferase